MDFSPCNVTIPNPRDWLRYNLRGGDKVDGSFFGGVFLVGGYAVV
jgi:hypothetical protein